MIILKTMALLIVTGIFAASCIIINIPKLYHENDNDTPSLKGYWGIENNYVSMPEEIPKWVKELYKTVKIGDYCPGQFEVDEKFDLAYKVTFKNKDKIIEKFYHKTKPFAFTIKIPKEKPYTLIADREKGVYSIRAGELRYKKYDTGHWTMKHPEPDDYNPNTGNPFPQYDTDWYKMCEWHKKTE